MTADSREPQLRIAVLEAARGMNRLGINRGRSGNVSARCRPAECAGFDGFVVTPTGMLYDAIGPEDLVAVHMDGRVREGERRRPSSEWRFHRDIYRAYDTGSVVHTHSVFATTLACLGRGIPAFHYMVAVAGGKDIPCAPYASFGTPELADAAVAALAGRRACLLAQHGMIAHGETPAAALELAAEVETLAEMYWRALQIRTPPDLPDEEMARILEKFAEYGQRGQG